MLRKLVAVALALAAQPLMAHTGHNAPPAHVHGWGIEHIALLGVVVVIALFAAAGRK